MTSDAQVCKYDSNTIHQILMQPLEVDKTSLWLQNGQIKCKIFHTWWILSRYQENKKVIAFKRTKKEQNRTTPTVHHWRKYTRLDQPHYLFTCSFIFGGEKAVLWFAFHHTLLMLVLFCCLTGWKASMCIFYSSLPIHQDW